jgi:DNA-binding transcriptional ArsR family regulator
LGALGERSLEDVCLEWKGKVDAVLAEENRDEADRMLKERVRESLGVIGEAVRRYRYALFGE